MTQPKVLGYLPDQKPSLGKLILYAIQQVIVMFPATVTVALITGFQVSTTIFASGLATVCFILITGRKIPMYYGSSFAYLSAISGLIVAVLGVLTGGILFGSGYEPTRALLEGHADLPWYFGPLKFVSTLIAYLSGLPGRSARR